MLPKHSLPQLVLGRIHGTLARLEHLIWQNQIQLKVQATSPQAGQLSLSEAKSLPLKTIEEGKSWGRLFDQRYCHIQFSEPTQTNTWLSWLDQGEATLYVNDTPYFGFNVAHRQCLLPEGISEVWLQCSCVQSAIWHPAAHEMKEGSLFEGAQLCSRQDETWHAYHDLKCLFDLAMELRSREKPNIPRHIQPAGLQPSLDSCSPVLRLLLRIMNEAVDALEQESVKALRERLANGYRYLKQDKALAQCILTGHAHVDLVWIWPERIGELKAVNVFATVNYLMDKYEEFRFAYSQAASYEAVAKREPKLIQKTLKKVKTGQWEATGAMYVESDTIFACGEALARGFVIGQEEFKEINGKPSRLAWLPDVFGYSACLPQIMNQTGVDFFFTTKMTWNAINRFPYSSFTWRGHDGSEVLAHVTQDSGYNNNMQVGEILTAMDANQQADLHPEYLLPVGYGDGGGGPTEEMIERAQRLNKLQGMPETRWDQPEAFFERLETVDSRLPIHHGECYLEFHRGTYTTHGNLKNAFRALERALQTNEAIFSVLGKQADNRYIWKRLIFAQFHDYIPGSSIWDAYLEGVPELESLAQETVQISLNSCEEPGEDCLFNPHAVPLVYWIKKNETPEAVELPPLSGTPISTAKRLGIEPAFEHTNRRVSNGDVSLSLDENGWIENLVWEGTVVPCKEPLGALYLYPDHAACYDAWDIDRHVLSMGQRCDTEATIERVKPNKYSAGLKVTRSVGKKSIASVSFILEAGCPLVHIEVALDWHEEESLLKLHFPTKYAASSARYGIPFGSVLRPQLASSVKAEAMWEVPFNRHMAVFDDGENEGFSIITEAKYGASVRDGEIGVSLVRSPRVTGYDLAHAHAWSAKLTRLENVSTYSDQGKHFIKLCIGKYKLSLPRHRQPAMLADTLFTAPLPYRGQAVTSFLKAIEGGESLIPCWAIPAKSEGWILRLNEVLGQRGTIQLKFSKPTRLYLTDLGELSEREVSPGAPISFSPYQVISIRIVTEIMS